MTRSKTEEVKFTKLERSLRVKKKEMKTGKDGADYGTVPGISKDFLLLSGAAKLAEEFGINAVLRQDGLKEEVIDGKHFITVTLDMVDENKNVICSGIGTWDNGEPNGSRPMARQRGMAMAYKRAYVLGIRYATNSFGIFTQDEDIIKQDEKEEKRNPNNDSTGNEFSDGPQTFFQFDPANNDWIFIKGKLKSQNGNKVWTLTETKEQEPGYLRWILENVSDLIAEDREKIVEALES